MGRRRIRKRKLNFPWLETMAAIIAAILVSGSAYLLSSPYLLPAGMPEPQEQGQVEEPVKIASEETTASDWEWVPKEPVTHSSILLLGLDDHGMADVIMIATYDLDTFKSSLLSIKRDTFVENQPWGRADIGQSHLAWANYHGILEEGDFAGGARMAAFTVEQMLGIEIHAYASIDFEGFVDLIDYLGGVTVNVAPGFAERPGQALPTGLQRLNGEQALIYARHRMNPRIPEPGSTSQDGDRIRRNQVLLKALAEQCRDMETDELMALVDRLEGNLFTSMDDWDILQLINILYHNDAADIETAVLPGEGKMVFEDLIDQEVYYYFLDHSACRELLRDFGLIRD